MSVFVYGLWQVFKSVEVGGVDKSLLITNETKELIKKNVFLMKKEVLMTGEHLTEAKVSLDNMYNEPNISMSFDDEGAKEFERITEAHKYKNLAIILDNNVYSAPRIKEKISGGKAQIEG
ncbi:MAG: hypothetical protein AAB965_03395, partial [Patescibacteria group bacterium]